MSPNAHVIGLDHYQLLCPPGGEDAAREFWVGVIGLPEVEKPEPLRARGGVWFRCGAQGLHVGAEPGFEPARRAHPAIRLRDEAAYEQLVDRLTAAGHAVEEADVPIADRRMKTTDCFGNMLEFVVGTTG